MPEITMTKKEILDMITFLKSGKLRESAVTFIDSIKAQIEQGFIPTENQISTLYRMYNQNKNWTNRGVVTFREEVSQQKI